MMADLRWLKFLCRLYFSSKLVLQHSRCSPVHRAHYAVLPFSKLRPRFSWPEGHRRRASLLRRRVLGGGLTRLDVGLQHLLGYRLQVSLVRCESHSINLWAVKQDTHDLARVIRVLGVDRGVNGVTNLLLHLWGNWLSLRLLGLLLTSTKSWEVVSLRQGLLLWLTTRTLTIRRNLTLTSVVVELATTASVEAATALLAHVVHLAFITVKVLGRVQELLHLTPLLLISLLS